MAKMKKRSLPRVSEDVEQLGLSDIAGGIQSGTTSLENCLAVSAEAKCISTLT